MEASRDKASFNTKHFRLPLFYVWLKNELTDGMKAVMQNVIWKLLPPLRLMQLHPWWWMEQRLRCVTGSRAGITWLDRATRSRVGITWQYRVTASRDDIAWRDHVVWSRFAYVNTTSKREVILFLSEVKWVRVKSLGTIVPCTLGWLSRFLVLSCIIVYMDVCFVCFCLIL
jgi:hypothetical protein